MKTDISYPFQSVVRAAHKGNEFSLVAGCRPEYFIALDDDVNYYIIEHLSYPAVSPFCDLSQLPCNKLWLWYQYLRVNSPGILRHLAMKIFTDVSKYSNAFIFRAKQSLGCFQGHLITLLRNNSVSSQEAALCSHTAVRNSNITSYFSDFPVRFTFPATSLEGSR
jgi:hypothetical protein